MYPLGMLGRWWDIWREVRRSMAPRLSDFAYMNQRKVKPKLKLPMVNIKRIKRRNRLLPKGYRFRGDVAV